MATTKIIPGVLDLNQASSENGLRMPKGGAFSGTPAEGMMRNDDTQASEGSASTMQHYNDAEWKNFVNTAACTTTTLDYPPSVGALALYQLESNGNDTGGTAAYNLANVGSGPTYVAGGKYGNCASAFTSLNYLSKASAPSALFGTSKARDFTISCWWKSSYSGSNEQILISFGEVGSTGSGVVLFINGSGHPRFQVSATSAVGQGGNGGAGGPFISYGVNMRDGAWHNIAGTYTSAGGTNDASLFFYIDGQPVNSDGNTTFVQSGSSWTNGTSNGWTTFTTDTYYLGTSGGGSPVEGEVDQVRLYNQKLSDANMLKIYQEIAC